MTLSYSDIDPNVIELLARQLESPLEKLIEEKIQRRQQWGPTFKQEDIAELSMTDADFIVPAPEYGKRVFRMAGTLSVQRVLRVPPIPSAWWIIHNRTSQSLHVLTDPTGVVGPVIPPDQVGAVYTDGVGVWQFACCGGETIPGGEEMPPGGTGTEIQYRLNATTFGGVSSSFTSGADVIWGGTHTINKAGNRSYEWFIDPGITAEAGNSTFLRGQRYSDLPSEAVVIDFVRGRGTFTSQADVTGGDIIGAIQFWCNESGAPVLCGGVRSTHDGAGGAIAIGHVDGGFSANGDGSIGLYHGTGVSEKVFEIGSTGFLFSHGINNSVFYQNATGFFVPVPAGSPGHVLTLSAGGVPVWGTVAGASFPSLNQVTDPTATKTFNMANHQLLFQFAGADNEDSLVMESVDGAAGTGVVLLVRNGTGSNKAPFRVGINGASGGTVFGVNSGGSVGVGDIPPTFSTDTGYKLNVFGNAQMEMVSGTGRTLEIERSSNVTGGSGSASFRATETGAFSVGGIYTNIEVSTHAAFTGTAGTDIRGVTSSMIHDSAASNPPRLRSFVAFFDSSISADVTAPGSYTAYFAPTLSNGQIYSGNYRGLYLQIPGDTWANYYGVVAESGFVNGFGTNVPTATMHVVGTVRFDLGSDGLGDIYFRSATSGPLVALHNSGSAWDGRVLTLSSGIPVWATATGGPGSTTPGGDPGNLQYNVADTSFGGITSTSFGLDSDSLSTLAMGPNQFTVGTKDSTSYIGLRAINTQSTRLLIQAGHVTQTPTLLFQRSEASLGNLATGKSAGDIQWEARVGGAWVVQGLLKTSYSATLGGTVWLSSGTGGSRIEIFQKTVRVTAIDGSPYWQYEYTSTGPKWTNSSATHGLQGAIYYVSSTIAQTALPISTTAGQVLTTTEISAGVWEPRWANPSGGPGGGITSTGGNTNSIQYRSGAGTTTLGGVNTAIGVLIASATNGLASFSTTLPTTRLWFSPGTTAGLNVGQGFTQPTSINSVDGDMFYDSSLGKFRVRENGVWQDMRGGLPALSTTGALMGTVASSIIEFSNTFPSTRMWFSPSASTAGLNVGSRGGAPTGVAGDIYYDSSLNKFRAYQGSSWTDLIGGAGSVSPPVSLDYTATVNQPTLYVNHLQAGPASTVANVYGEIHWFRHLHSGTVSDGRRGFTFAWDHQASGTGGTSAGGDIIIEIYGTNASGMSLSSYTLTGFTIGTFFNTQVGSWTALRIKEVNANVRRAIVVDLNAGDVVIGGALATTATQGFLFIPSCPGVPTGSPANFPAGTCALCYDSTNDNLYANDGVGGWNLV